MTDRPFFSIVTVTYNARETLERTILSVRDQTFRNLEHIIIDGASNDGTLELISRYRNLLGKVVSEPDRGLYEAMNKGLRLSQGEYVCFLNAGDKLHSERTLELIAKSIQEGTRPDILYGETQIVDQEGQFLRMRRLRAPEKLTFRSFQKGMLVCHQSFLVSRRLKGIEYDLRWRYSSDYDWCIRVMKAASLIHNTHLVITDYLEEGLTTRHHRASLVERLKIMSRHYGLLRAVGMHLMFIPRAVLLR